MTAVPGWKTRPEGPAFDAARRALRAGYGCDAVADRLRRLDPVRRTLRRACSAASPRCCSGLEDPPCNAHGENESLDLEDFAKAAKSSAHLLAELSGIPRARS